MIAKKLSDGNLFWRFVFQPGAHWPEWLGSIEGDRAVRAVALA
jgi:hypothetical protein